MASPMEALNASQTSIPGTIHATISSAQTGILSRLLESTGIFSVVITLLAIAVVYDQSEYGTLQRWRLATNNGFSVSYRKQKANLAGDSWKIPFVGPFFDSVNPEFGKYYTKWKSGDLSCVSVFHKFVIIAATRDMARKVFNSPMYVKPCVVDVAHKIFRPDNWVFLDGKEHVEYRKGLNGLFTRQAMETYLPGQQEVYNEYFEEFLQASKDVDGPQPFAYRLRQLMCAVSCRTMVGHYMSRVRVKKMADEYYAITAAFELVNFPWVLPFTKPWYGKKACDSVLDTFANCAAKAKVRMRQKGAEPECIMDRWVMQMFESERYRERIAKGEEVPQEEKPAQLLRMFSDLEISKTVMTFLFASQDATSSACSWLLQLIADRPDMLAKVREEGARIRPDPKAEVKFEDLEKMVSQKSSAVQISIGTQANICTRSGLVPA